MKASEGGRRRPPLLPFGLSVGIISDRMDTLPPDTLRHLDERLRKSLGSLAAAAADVHAGNAEFFAREAPRLTIVSQLSDAIDQRAASLGLELGFELQAVLPFERGQISDDAGRLLEKAATVLELPGDRASPFDAVVMAGRATISHCDVLIAVWDGHPPRGRTGTGTGDIVHLAHDWGKPVLHISIDEAEPMTLRWTAFEPAVITTPDDAGIIRPFDEDELKAIVSALLAPPPSESERRFLAAFQQERRRKIRGRIEYPLMLAIAGVSRFGRHHWRSDASSEWTEADWRSYQDASRRANAPVSPLGELQSWYDWADNLAGHFAQTYRSGHVFNFVLGALAVLLGTANLVAPRWSILFELALFYVVLAILANTWVGHRNQWHRRWLDYRQLAERLRPMRSLKLLGIAAPRTAGTEANPVPQRWVEWYAAGVWRALGCPNGKIEEAGVPAIARTIADQEIQPQIDYHRSAAAQSQKLDTRLGRIGFGVFGLALLSSIVLLSGFAWAPDWVARNYNWFTVISAGLPAIGTAVVGIRVQGDHSGISVRSALTAQFLDQVAERLRADGISLSRAAELTEQASRSMLADLDEWRLLNQQHELSIG